MRIREKMKIRTNLVVCLIFIVVSACSQVATPVPPIDPSIAITQAFATVKASFTQNALIATPILTHPPSIIAPTVVLQSILIATTSCRFGPHKAYATRFKVGIGKFEVIGRDVSREWILIRQPGMIKSCWVNAKFVSVEGDVLNLQVTPVQLEINNNYAPPANVIASRTGEHIQIVWNDVTIQDRDLSSTGRFLLEIWICENRHLVFKPINTSDLSGIYIDQPGCADRSRGLIYTATKRGYSVPAEIPWPPH
jgi:hypothetical protein